MARRIVGRKVVGLGGTLRPNSSSERLVRAVLAECTAQGAQVEMFDGPTLATLPHFNPESADRTPEQIALVNAVRAADALVIGTPGYHGGLSGLVKNAIDLLEDTRTDTRAYWDGMPVGLIVSAAGWQAGGVTLGALRGIVHAMRGWPTPVGLAINTIEQRPFAPDGTLADAGIAAQVTLLAHQIMGFRLEIAA